MRSPSRAKKVLIRRWLEFNAIGAMGISVQLIAVYLFGSIGGMDSFWATTLAVEAAVLHNFLWHDNFTWAERRFAARRRALFRLLTFNGTTGAVSLAGNAACVLLLIRELNAPLLASNLASIAACSVFNFLINDKFVFRTRNAVSPASQ